MTVYCCFTHRFDWKYGDWPKLEAVFTDESKAKEWIETLCKSPAFIWAGRANDRYWNWAWSSEDGPIRQAYIEKREAV